MQLIYFDSRKNNSTFYPGVHRLPGILIAALIAMLFTGCAAVGPDYVRVAPDVPKQWHSKLAGGLTPGELNPDKLARWWTVLNDAELSSLEARAVRNNLDLKAAMSRIREARARRGISRSGRFPTLDTSASVSRNRSSAGNESSFYSAGFDAGWELDVFGGVRRSVEAAQANLEATREDMHDVLVSLLAEVALNYVEARTYQTRIGVSRANIKAQEATYKLNLSRYEAGIIDELAAQQSLYNLESTRSRIPTLETGLEASKNRLAVLLGVSPGSIHQELSIKRPVPVPPLQLAVGVPADTLRHRPDIRKAERDLAAATAQIGVATADLYPKFKLTGTIGLESVSASDLLKYGNRTWSAGPGVSWNIFDAGAVRRNIEVKTALQEQAMIRYQSAILKAQEEVENALVAYAREQQRRDSLHRATRAAKKAYELAGDQYQAGLVDFSNVLDAQRSLQSFQDSLAVSEGAVTTNLIKLYKALGGGWTSIPDGAVKSIGEQ